MTTLPCRVREMAWLSVSSNKIGRRDTPRARRARAELLVCGKSPRFDGQRVGRTHVVADDIVEVIV
jgi:ribosome-interacting GTPase 1